MKFARVIIPIILMVGALAGCEGKEAHYPPFPSRLPSASGPVSVEEAMAICTANNGPGCKVVTLDVNVFDEDSNDILFSANHGLKVTVAAYAMSTGDDPHPVTVDVLDFRRGVYVQSPYTYTEQVPLTDIQVASPNMVQLTYDVTTALEPGWSMNCALWEGYENPVPVSQDDTKNFEDEPASGSCFVSWPAVTIPTLQ